MPETDLTNDHRALTENLSARRDPDFLAGLLAVFLGVTAIIARTFQAFGMFLLFVSPVFLAGYFAGGAFGIGVANLLLSPLTLSFVGYFSFIFLFPAYFDVVRLAGLFLQRCAYLRSSDTLGAVDRRWATVRQDFGRVRNL